MRGVDDSAVEISQSEKQMKEKQTEPHDTKFTNICVVEKG